MSLAISGPHRSGKSTLARAFAEYEGLPYVQTTASAVFERLGLSPSEKLPIAKRLDVQRQILDEFDALYSKAGSPLFVADRSPIDLLGYTMVEIGQKPMLPKHENTLYAYMDDCIEVLNRHFSTIAVLSSGIALVPEPGKASLSQPFIDHLSLVIEGLCMKPEVAPRVYRIPHYQLNLADRIDSLCSIMERRSDEHTRQLKLTEEYTGEPVIYH